MSLGIVGDHEERLFVFFPYVQRFLPCILYLRVDTYDIYGEVFRAVGELQDFSCLFLIYEDILFGAFFTYAQNISASAPFTPIFFTCILFMRQNNLCIFSIYSKFVLQICTQILRIFFFPFKKALLLIYQYMCIKRLAENFVSKALLVFEI